MKLLRYLAGLIVAAGFFVAADVFALQGNWDWYALCAVTALFALVLWTGSVLADRLDQLIVVPPPTDVPDEGPRYIGDR